MHLYFARSRQSKNKQTKNKDEYIAREITQYQEQHYGNRDDWKKTKLFQWLKIYIQKNMSSIILANCLLDLIFLPYFKNIFV